MKAMTCVALAVMLAAGLCEAAEANLIFNGDFSRVINGRPEGWEAAGDARSVTQNLSVQKEDGEAFAQLECTRIESAGASSHAMLAQIGRVELRKGRMYEFSCRLRGRDFRAGAVTIAMTDMKGWTNCGLYASVPVRGRWTAFQRIFRATTDVSKTGRLQIWFTEPGMLQMAEVRIVEIGAGAIEFTDVIPGGEGGNLIPNGSFEVGKAPWSSFGTSVGWGDLESLHGTIETSGGVQGDSFLRIPMGGGRTPVLYFDYYEPTVRPALRALAGHKGWIKVDAGSAYTLSCYMRASVEGTPAALGVQLSDPGGARRNQEKAVTLGKDWRRFELTFRPQQRYLFAYAGPALKQDTKVDVDLDGMQLEKGEKATAFKPRSEVEIGLEPPTAAQVLTYSTKIRSTQGIQAPQHLVLRVKNHGGSSVEVPVSFKVRDFEDADVPLPEIKVDVAANESAMGQVAVPQAWRGFYRIKAEARLGNRTEAAELRLAIVPRRESRETVCGINHAFATSRLIQLAKKAGVSSYRDWSVKWDHIEPRQGEYRWERADVEIDRVLKEGVDVLPMFPFPSAGWISEAPAGLPTTGYPGVRIRSAFAPRDPALMGQFIERAVSRYKDRLHAWEFLNEPIYTDYSLPADSTNRYGGKKYTPADYVALLKVAHEAIKKADPSCRVIGGIGAWPMKLTRELMEAGAMKHLDILNLHMYPDSRPPESFRAEMDKLLALMDQHGGRKPIWITEFSYYGADDLSRKPFIPSPNNWAEERLLDSERQCADYTVRYFAVMLSRGVQKIYIHAGSNASLNEDNLECALFTQSGGPRKLFASLAVMTSILGPDPLPAGEKHFGDSAHAVAFQTGEDAVVMVWQDERGSRTMEGEKPVETEVRDAMGRTIEGGRYRLSTSPVYVISDAHSAKEILGQIPD